MEKRQDSQQGWTFSSQSTIQRLTPCGEKAGQSAGMDIQLKAQFKDSHPVEKWQDNQQGWTFSSQCTIQTLTRCGEKAEQSAEMDIDLTKHNSKGLHTVERRQHSQQG
jgi:hypothetical protein